MSPRRTKIWIDLDNTPHVPFFIPIKRELERRGYEVVLTARDAFQVCDLADRYGLHYARVGRHYGKNMIMKLYGLGIRSLQLVPFVMRERPDVALSHGARSQVLLGNLLGMLTVGISDYEYAKSPPMCNPRWEIVPEAIPITGLRAVSRRVCQYPGLKEDVYAPEFRPDLGMFGELGIPPESFVVTVRPPADEAHYRNPKSEELFAELMRFLHEQRGILVVLLPRNRRQEDQMRSKSPEWFAKGKTIIPSRALDGMSLLWFSDLVVSGGGTMNREAAALGVPVYSIFLGKTGAVDSMLEREGRLVMIRNPVELREKICFRQRDKAWKTNIEPRPALGRIVDHVEGIIAKEKPRR